MAAIKLPEHIAAILATHLGASTADAVARHLCATHDIGDGAVDPAKLALLRDTIRRGLVAFVGPERADDLAARCLEGITEAP